MNKVQLFSCILITISCTQLQNLANKAQIFKEDDKEVKQYSIMLGETKNIFELTGYGQSLQLLLIHHHIQDKTKDKIDGICDPKPHRIEFLKAKNTFTSVLNHYDQEQEIQVSYDPNSSTDQNQETIQTMVHIKDGVALITSDLILFIYKFKKDLVADYHETQLLTQISLKSQRQEKFNQWNDVQLAYQPISKTLYVIFNDQIIYMKVNTDDFIDPMQVVSNIRNQHDVKFTSLEAIQTSYNLLYICTTDQIFVYISQQNGDLSFHLLVEAKDLFGGYNNKNIELTDIAIGGKKGEILYVLDKYSGVLLVSFLLDYQGKYNPKINDRLGLVSVQGGFKLDQYDDDSMIVLIEGAGTSRTHRAIEFNIDIKKNEWFRINEFHMEGRTSDVDISKEIAIIRGVDSHRVIFHSIWKGFYPSEVKEYLYAPHLKSLDFFEEIYGDFFFFENRYDKVHRFLFGVNNHQIIFHQWQEKDAYVECTANQELAENYNFIYTLNANTTDCIQRTLNLSNIVPDLSICQISKQFKVQVNGVLIGSTLGKYLSLLSMLILMLIIVTLSYLILRSYRRYQLKKNILNREIQGFVSKGYKLDDKSIEITGSHEQDL